MAFPFSVVSSYRGANDTTVTGDVSKVATARANAQTVVDANASKSASEKLFLVGGTYANGTTATLRKENGQGVENRVKRR